MGKDEESLRLGRASPLSRGHFAGARLRDQRSVVVGHVSRYVVLESGPRRDRSCSPQPDAAGARAPAARGKRTRPERAMQQSRRRAEERRWERTIWARECCITLCRRGASYCIGTFIFLLALGQTPIGILLRYGEKKPCPKHLLWCVGGHVLVC